MIEREREIRTEEGIGGKRGMKIEMRGVVEELLTGVERELSIDRGMKWK